MSEYEKATEDFISFLNNTNVAKEYFAVCKEVEANPELDRQLKEFRRRNFEMQNQTDGDVLFDEIDRFEEEYAEFRKNPLVSRFLNRELAFCRMFQEVSGRISIAFAENFDYSKGNET